MLRILILSLIASVLLSSVVTPVQAETVKKARFGDSKPVKWKARAPSTYPVHGIDVARFQEQIDWRAARRAGVNFAFIKVTEGGDLLDPKFHDHWRGAKKAGVARGAYHFYYFCTAPEVQARWFLKNAPKSRGALPPVLDMEWNPFSPTCKKRPPAAEVQKQMRTFLKIVERGYGQRPIIYTTPKFYRDAGLHQMNNEEYWLRSTAKTLDQAYPGQKWSFWQYSATGIIPGIEGDVDLNTFVGSKNDWKAWRKRRQR